MQMIMNMVTKTQTTGNNTNQPTSSYQPNNTYQPNNSYQPNDTYPPNNAYQPNNTYQPQASGNNTYQPHSANIYVAYSQGNSVLDYNQQRLSNEEMLLQAQEDEESSDFMNFINL